MNNDVTVTLAFPASEVRPLWQACNANYHSFKIPPGVVAAVNALAVAQGIACSKHNGHAIGEGWFQDPVTHAEWRPLPGECFRCCAEAAQANMCPRCNAVIHIPGGRGAPVPAFCAECGAHRAGLTPEERAASDAAFAKLQQEREEIRLQREDRERRAAEDAATKAKRKRKK